MWKPDKHEIRRAARLAAAAALLIFLAAPPPAPAQGETPALRDEIEAAYEVLPVTGGVVLRPRAEGASYAAVEITDRGIAVDGDLLDEGELRARLGEEAEVVLRLAALSAAERRGLLRPVEELEAAPGSDRVEAPEGVTLPEEPEPPHKIKIGEKVIFGGSVTVGPDEVAREVVVIGGSLEMAGEVEREVVVVGGSAYINGEVGREVTVVGGSLELGPEARLRRDVQLIGSSLERDPGAVVDGAINEVGLFGPGFQFRDLGEALHDFEVEMRPRFRFWGYLASIFGQMVWLALVALILCLVVLVGEPLVVRAERKVAAEPWKAGGAGFLFQVLLLPLLVMVILFLVITIIGIPLLLLLPFVVIGLIVLAIFGYTAVALRVGRLVQERFGWDLTSPYKAVLAGVVTLKIWCVVAEVLDFPPLGWLAGLIAFFAFLIGYVATTVGFGALLLIFFERRRGLPPAAAPLPPLPPAEPAPEPAPEEGGETPGSGPTP